MPIYAYRCETCGHAKDVLQKMSDPVLTTCPSCGAESFKKQLTAAGFQQNVAEAPATISVVPGEQLRQEMVRDLGDAIVRGVYEGDLAVALDRAAAAASITVSRAGANPPTRAELEA